MKTKEQILIHELSNKLAKIIGFSSMLQTGTVPVQEKIEKIIKAANEALEILNKFKNTPNGSQE